ncbi:hypothetical protein L486_05556 [Kwoniella mangroviensis CBS 10435]|uniref:Aminoglycoside phosphotransferase domain-containing protein n=1 Tax=Kwoniella mangroviensis CBS 10435 TaxID=1331196 RepID=A0A1B9IMB1_9TREE|nr:hypothetical protein L486_05556 [Kwoniella mangroviensis CBS 10435]
MPELYEKSCAVANCGEAVIDRWAECEWCWNVYCKKHDKVGFHLCRQWPYGAHNLDEKRAIKAQARKAYYGGVITQIAKHQNFLVHEAETLRPGHSCQLTIPQDLDAFAESSKIGIFNLHFLITFNDGVKWLLRVRQDKGHRPPAEIARTVIESEVATLGVLKEGGLPVAKGYLLLSLETSEGEKQKLPFDYFFCEFLEGTPFKVPRADWYGSIDLQGDRLLHFIDEYAKIQIQLSDHPLPFTRIGCLCYEHVDNGDRPVKVGPIVCRGTFMKTQSPYFFGPFSTNKERYLANIDATLNYDRHYAPKTLRTLDRYLWHLELRELVNACNVLKEEPKEVYIKHDDEKGDHFLVDEEEKVTGIIDWEWAYVTTKAEAFASPWLFYRDQNYRLGSNELTSDQELLIEVYKRYDRPDLADCVRNGRLYARLDQIGHYEQTLQKSGFREVFGKDILGVFDPPRADVDWRVYMMKRCKNDKGLIGMMKRCKWPLERAEKEAETWNAEQGKKRADMRELEKAKNRKSRKAKPDPKAESQATEEQSLEATNWQDGITLEKSVSHSVL